MLLARCFEKSTDCQKRVLSRFFVAFEKKLCYYNKVKMQKGMVA